MRVLFVNLTSSYGGGEVYLRRLIDGLHRHGIDARLLTVPGPLPELVKADHSDIPIHYSRVDSYYTSPLLRGEIEKMLQTVGADVLHLNGHRALHLACLLYRLSVPKVVTFHSDPPLLANRLSRQPYGLFLGISARAVDHIICVCDYHRAQLQQWIPAPKLCTVHHGMPPVPPGNQQPPAIFTVVMLARLEESKGHLTLFAAIHHLVKNRPGDWRVLCLGEGPDRKRYEKVLKGMELESIVQLAGFVPDPLEWLGRASVVVLPSYREGFPLSLLEAMACGKPVIATAVSGIPEIIVDGVNGFLIPPGDVYSLAHRLEYLASHPVEVHRMGMQARQTVETQFDLSLMLEGTLAVYQACLTRRIASIQSPGAGNPNQDNNHYLV